LFKERHFPTFDAAVAAMVEELAEVVRGRLAAPGACVLALGGGRTPLAVLPRLARVKCDWSRVTVTLTDERRVAPDDPASNEGLVRRHLLQGPAAKAAFVGLRDATDPPPQPDVIYLGFGEDGHVASLFPGGPELAADHRGVVAAAAPVAPTARLSLTLATLLAARHLVMLVSGAEKHAVYTRAKAETTDPRLPLARVLHGDGPQIDVFVAPA
jgi:6-phosphogluconolactonase